jgi:serine/threonine-protein kinase HipA
MLANTDGHAKNFSIFIRPGGAFRLTPLCDILSAHPVIGDGPNLTPYQDAKLAMAVRSKNPKYRLQEILRRHWNVVARRNGIGESAEAIIEELFAKTPEVIDRVRAQLPADFHAYVADRVSSGLREASQRLATMSPA